MGILDPGMMSLTYMQTARQEAVDYLASAIARFVRRDYIMFMHNLGGQWVLVVIIPKWNKVMYFDSQRSQLRNYNLLKGVIDEYVSPS